MLQFFYMTHRFVIIGLLVVSFCFRSFAFGQEELTLGEVKVIANHKERLEKRLIAGGNVEVHYKELRIFADRIELDMETKDVFAEGNVVIQMPQEVISVDSIEFNLETKRGVFHNVHGLQQPNIFYEAESVEKKSEEVYDLEKAKFTTCTQPTPRWRFSASRASLKKDKYLEMWNSVIRIKNIPVFYLPYWRYPLKREKSTGLLTPNLGFNGQKGFHFSETFYWDMKRNMDSAFYLDYYGTRGLGAGLEYRYLLSGGTGGRINLYYFKFKDDPQLALPENAYLVRINHNQPLPQDFNLVADVDYQSSYEFLREFDNNFRRAVVSNRRSQVYLSRAWSYFNLNMRLSRFETHYTERDNAIIRNNLPEIGFSSSQIKLFSPLYLSFSTNFRSWEYGWAHANRQGVDYNENFEEGTQRYSQSLSFNPVLSFPFSSIPWLAIKSSLSTNLSYDFQSYAPNTKTIVNEPLLRKSFTFNMDFIGPVFYKITFDEKNEPKLKHVIEPSFTYRYQSSIDQSDRVITSARFFTRDHFIRYGLTNRIIIKKDKMPREVFTLGMSQVYYIDPEDSPLQNFEVDGEIPQFSDIDTYLRFYPETKYSLDFSLSLNPYHWTFSRLRLGANLGRPTDSLFLRVSWYKSLNPYFDNTFGQRHQISFYAGAKIPKLNLDAIGSLDYNIKEREFQYSALSLVYHYQCLDFKVDVRIFYFREKPEAQFSFSFGLGNIGSTTDFLGGTGF